MLNSCAEIAYERGNEDMIGVLVSLSVTLSDEQKKNMDDLRAPMEYFLWRHWRLRFEGIGTNVLQRNFTKPPYAVKERKRKRNQKPQDVPCSDCNHRWELVK